MNSITEKIFYTNGSNQNQRFIISANIPNPIAWQVSKVETMSSGVFGLQRLTFAQIEFNPATDYIDGAAVNPDGTRDIYAMYADYNMSAVKPSDPGGSVPSSEMSCIIKSSTDEIKIGGSYKMLEARLYDVSGADVTDGCIDSIGALSWTAEIDGNDITESPLISWRETDTPNTVKIKFGDDRSCMGKTLVVKCSAGDAVGKIQFEIISL